MPKKAKRVTFRKVEVKTRKRKEWAMPAALKKALSDHELWPHLKAKHWQKVAREVLDLSEDIRTDDRRYNVIRQHCKNERRRRDAMAQVQRDQQPEEKLDQEMHEPGHTQPLALDEDGELDYDADAKSEPGQEQAEDNIIDIDTVELKHLRQENKELKEQLDSLKTENVRLRSQLQARDEWLQQAGARMLSFGTDGRAGYWQKNLQKYLTQVSKLLQVHARGLETNDKMLRLPHFEFSS